MDTTLDEPVTETGAHPRPDGSGTGRTVRHPSVDFPPAPVVELVIPETWRPIGVAVLNEMRTQPDIAVAGPDVVDGVRPNLMVKTSRVPGTEGGHPPEARTLLARLFDRQADERGVLDFEFRIHDDGPQPYGVSRHRELPSGVEVLRLTCAIVVSSDPIRYLVITQASASPADELGLAAIEAAFGSLRIAAPVPPTDGRTPASDTALANDRATNDA